jgi:hypothetical protein
MNIPATALLVLVSMVVSPAAPDPAAVRRETSAADSTAAGRCEALLTLADRQTRDHQFRAARQTLLRAVRAAPTGRLAKRAAERLIEVEALLGSGRVWDRSDRPTPAQKRAGKTARTAPAPPRPPKKAPRSHGTSAGKRKLKEIDRQTARIRAKLQATISFEFTETPLREVLTFLSNASDVNFILDPAGTAGDRTVTLRVTRMTVEQALDWIMELSGLAYTIKNSAVFVSAPSRLPMERIVVVYPVSDVTFKVRDYPGPQLGIPGQEPLDFGPVDAGPEDLTAEDLRSLIESVMRNAARRPGRH